MLLDISIILRYLKHFNFNNSTSYQSQYTPRPFFVCVFFGHSFQQVYSLNTMQSAAETNNDISGMRSHKITKCRVHDAIYKMKLTKAA